MYETNKRSVRQGSEQGENSEPSHRPGTKLRTDNTSRITRPKNGDKTNLSMTHEMPQNPLCNIISVHTETNRRSHRIKKRPVANGAQ